MIFLQPKQSHFPLKEIIEHLPLWPQYNMAQSKFSPDIKEYPKLTHRFALRYLANFQKSA